MKKSLFRFSCILIFASGVVRGEERDTTLNLGKKVLVANKFAENQLLARGQTTKIVTGALMTIFAEMDKNGKLMIPEPNKKRALAMTTIPSKAYEALDVEKHLELAAGIYTKEFTQEELKAILDFYNSPAGAKLARLQWKIDQKISTATLDMDNSALRKSFQKYQKQILSDD